MTNPKQLSLPVYLPDDETFTSFYPGSNDQLIESLTDLLEQQDEAMIYLWGAAKSGRTHLLHACCAAAHDKGQTTFYIPFEAHASMSPAILEGLHDLSLICLDNLDHVAGNPMWEEALFDLYNRVREKGGKLVVSSSAAPNQSGFNLPDLVSRLNWGLCYQVKPMTDEDKLTALQRRAESRGLHLPDDIGKYLFNRLDRDLRTLFDTLDKLDKASMAAQRKLTIPFIKETLRF